MMRRKKIGVVKKKTAEPAVMYFSADTQLAIEEYQLTTEKQAREALYMERILPAFDKLVENLIFMYGFYNKCEDEFSILKLDCIAFLYETIHKFDGSRGTKAFSYFNVVARNWLIIKSQQNSKKNRRQVSIDDNTSLSSFQKKLIENHSVIPSHDDVMVESHRKEEILKLLQEIKRRIKNENELLCIDAIVNIFTQVDDIEFLNKRAIFVYIRDMSNLSPKQVSIAMSQVRRHYKELSRSETFGLFS